MLLGLGWEKMTILVLLLCFSMVVRQIRTALSNPNSIPKFLSLISIMSHLLLLYLDGQAKTFFFGFSAVATEGSSGSKIVINCELYPDLQDDISKVIFLYHLCFDLFFVIKLIVVNFHIDIHTHLSF